MHTEKRTVAHGQNPIRKVLGRYLPVLLALTWALLPVDGTEVQAATQSCPSDGIATSYNDYWDQVREGYGVSGDAIPGTNPTLVEFVGTHVASKSDADDDRTLYQDEKMLWSDGVMAAETSGTVPRTEYRWQGGTTWEYSWDHVKYFGDPAVIQDFRMVAYLHEKSGFSGTGTWIIMAYSGDDQTVDTSINLDGSGNYYVTFPYSPTASLCGGLDETGTPVSISYQEFDLTPLMSRLSAAGYDNVELRFKAVHDSGASPSAILLTQEVELAVTIGGGPVSGRVTICSDCHAFPPADAPGGVRNTPAGAVAGSHQAHSSMGCEVCHSNIPTESIHGDTGFGHFNRNVDMQASIQGGTYSRGVSFAIDPDITPAGLGTCGSVACHYNTPQTWGGVSMTCTSCHGQPPAQGAHGTHFGTTVTNKIVDCNNPACHVKPASNVTATHPDGTVQQSCSLSSCHNRGLADATYTTPAWTDTGVNCTWCHGNPPASVPDHTGIGAGNCQVCHPHNASGSPATHMDNSVTYPNATCTSCHGQPPNGATAPNRNNSHSAHFGTVMTSAITWGCTTATCHPNNTAQNHADGTTTQTCNNGQCHNPTTWFSAAAIGSNPTPAWGVGGPATCGWCHDNPPTDAAAAYQHGGVTPGQCSGCHPHNGDGSQHLDGTYQGGGDCITCHTSTQTGTHGTPRDAVVSEFGLAWGHKKSGRATVQVSDCIVCHLEGEYATQATSALHKDGNIDLRDPDGAGETPITNNSGGAFTFTQYAVSYTAGSRTTTLGNTVAEVITVKFCMACHDNNGATNPTARTTYGTPTAAMPFGGIQLGSNYNSTNNAIGTQGLIDVKTQFSTAMTSRHPVGAPNTRAYPYSTRLPVPYNNIGTARNSNTQALGSGTRTTANSVVMVCDDCHTDSTTISSRVTNRTLTAHGASSSIAGTYFVDAPTLCLTCHIPLASDPTNQFYNNENTNGGRHGTGSGLGNASTTRPRTVMNYCNECHFSMNTNYNAGNRPRYAQDVHGFDSIYGTSSGWPAGNGSGMRPRAFMRSSQAGAGGGSWPTNVSPRPYSAPGITAGNATCGGSSNLNAGNSGGSCNDNHTTYSPGGAY